MTNSQTKKPVQLCKIKVRPNRLKKNLRRPSLIRPRERKRRNREKRTLKNIKKKIALFLLVTLLLKP